MTFLPSFVAVHRHILGTNNYASSLQWPCLNIAAAFYFCGFFAHSCKQVIKSEHVLTTPNVTKETPQRWLIDYDHHWYCPKKRGRAEAVASGVGRHMQSLSVGKFILSWVINHPTMGVDSWVDRGAFPLPFEVQWTPCVLFPCFFRDRHFCTNAYGIYWIMGAILIKFSQLMKIIKIITTRC